MLGLPILFHSTLASMNTKIVQTLPWMEPSHNYGNFEILLKCAALCIETLAKYLTIGLKAPIVITTLFMASTYLFPFNVKQS